MSRLALFLLGAPRIERNQVPISVDTRKAIALLAYLAVTRQRQSRDKLAALLWPDYDQTHARAALRRTLSTLHKALEGEWLDLEREQLGLHSGPDFWLDVDAFSQLLAACQHHGHPISKICPTCVDPLAEAVALYRDDFLAGFSLRDSPDFDDWQFFQAESFRHDLASALERLVSAYSALGDFDAAIATARRWLALDRLHEPAHRYLMQLYAWAGQRATALHQYRECVQIMEQELGVAPLEATTHIYQAIKENHPPSPPVLWDPPSAPGPGKMANSIQAMPTNAPVSAVSHPPWADHATNGYPLVGRAAEWAALTRTYAESHTGGHLIIIEGEAGIGKTRLAEEFLASVRQRGATPIAARCYQGEMNLAYGPLVTGLRAALSQQDSLSHLAALPSHWLSEAARLLPELASLRPDTPAAPPLDGPGAQSRFFEALKQVIQVLHREKEPSLLFWDDIQWADNASLDFLTYLIRRLHESPLCLILTWRNELAPTSPRLQHMLSEAQRSGNVITRSLGRLSQPTISELVQSTTINDPTLVERLYQETEGIPFFLVEYLAALANGVIIPESEDWSLPGGVRDLLHSRLIAVSETGWQLLTAAAVIGRSFDFDTLREASGRSEEETVTALEELHTMRLIREVQSGTGEQSLIYDFNHEKLRELVYEETSLARRRLLHRRIAEALTSRAHDSRESGALAGQIAYHYRLAGNEPTAAVYFKLAGDHARSLYANTEALDHFQTALALGFSEPATLHESIGDLRTLLGEYSAALRSYETAAALCEPQALSGIEHKLGAVYERRGDWEFTESHFEAALAALSENSAADVRSSIYADWSRTAHHRGESKRALDLAQKALDLAEAAHETRSLAKAHNILGILANSQGDLALARRHLEESLALAERLNDLGTRVAALNNLALVCRASGAVDRAIQFTETALALCAAQGDRHREAALHNNLADLLHSSGRSEEAMSHLKQAVIINTEIDKEAGPLQPEIWKLTEW